MTFYDWIAIAFGAVGFASAIVCRASPAQRKTLARPRPLWRQWADTADALEKKAQASLLGGMPYNAADYLKGAKVAQGRARELKAEWDDLHPKADCRPPLDGTTYRQPPKEAK